MSLLGRSFRWLSQSQFLKRNVPRLRVVRRAVRRFIPGEELQDALSVAEELADDDLSSVLTRLGEHVQDVEAAGKTTEHYVRVLERCSGREPQPEISVKPSHLGLHLGESVARRNIRQLASAAEDAEGFIWFDMEESEWARSTLRLFERARRHGPRFGVCLQSYLHRTPDDLEKIVERDGSIRLVKGAYREEASVALQDDEEIDRRFLTLSERLLASASRDGVRHAIATHDERLIDRVREAARALDVDHGQYEVQMLYGIRPSLQRRLAAEGHSVRVLVSYGAEWFPWYMRRLAERPANALLVLRNLPLADGR